MFKLYLLQEFPPKSKLDSQLYGDNTSTITKENLEPNLGGLTVEQVNSHFFFFIFFTYTVHCFEEFYCYFAAKSICFDTIGMNRKD